jgi:hypothetical protein
MAEGVLGCGPGASSGSLSDQTQATPLVDAAPPPATETRRIADITIGERHRRDMGDIEGLARSLDELGLLQPIVIQPDGTLN